MGVLNIFYYEEFLFTLIGILLIFLAAGGLMTLLKKNEKTAKMLEKKELWQRITDEEDHYE